MVKTWIPHYLPMQQEFENVCFAAVLMKKQKLRVFVHLTLKWLLAIDLSSWVLLLFVVKQGKRGNKNLFLSSWQTGWCKFQTSAVIHS